MDRKMIHLIINGIAILISTLAIPAIATDVFTSLLQDLPEEEIRRESDREKYKNVIVNYGSLTNKFLMIVRNKPSSIVFSKAVMCGNHVYPTVVVRTIKEDSQDKYSSIDTLLIFNELLERLADEYETTIVSNKLSSVPNKFKVGVQPKFTLETVEAFVCNSQAPLCEADEEVSYQCTFKDGRQANVCNGNGRPPNVLRVGKSSSQLDINHRVLSDYQFHKYSKVTNLPESSLSGIGNTLSFTDGNIDYSFENHWSTHSRDDYNFHTEFNIRKDGKIIESNRCVESNYK